MIVLQLPLRVNANARGHSRFQKRIGIAGEKYTHRQITLALLKQKLKIAWGSKLGAQLDAGLLITLTRIAPSKLDGHDNIRTALKPIADGVTDALGLKSDRDPRLTFAYAQEPRGVRVYGVEVKVAARPDARLVTCPRCGGQVPVPEVGA